MPKLSHTKMVFISGLIWFTVGVYLLQMGIKLLLSGVHSTPNATAGNYPLLHFLENHLGNIEFAAILLLACALLIGYFKGRYVLGKSARRGVDRILSFPNPMKLTDLYSAKYYILLGTMVFLGISLKHVGLNHDVRGWIDVVIGSALINGALVYFHSAYALNSDP